MKIMGFNFPLTIVEFDSAAWNKAKNNDMIWVVEIAQIDGKLGKKV